MLSYMGIKEIAEKAGVSKTTVSLALNGHKGVSEEMRLHIVALAKEMNYRVPGNRSYIQRQNGIIVFAKLSRHGLILNSDQNNFIVNYIEGIHHIVKEFGYSFEINTQRIETMDTFIAEINQKQPKGLIVLGTELKPEDILSLASLSVPYIVLDTYYEHIATDFVTMANISAVHTLVEHFVDKHHSDIMMVASGIATGNIAMRERGFRLAMEHYGLTISEQSFITVQPGFEGAYRDMLCYIHAKKHIPQALFCYNDVAAFGVIKALKDCGYAVPKDISIIGFDDLPMSLMMEPRLTSISVPTQRIGAIAARSLVEMLLSKSPHTIKSVLVQGKLVVRESVLDRK